MVITEKTWLPTEEELTVQEINVTYPVLRAAAFQLGKFCEWQRNEFWLCKEELKDPRKCMNEGKDLTACGIKFFQKVKKSCADEFTQYYNCIDKSSSNGELYPCRKTQKLFDECVKKHLNQDRPPIGHFATLTVHDTKRPPPPKPKKIVFDDLADEPPQGPYPNPPRYAYDNTSFK